jgi:hypothetical protein
MDSNTEKLLKMKTAIDNAKKTADQSEGALKQLKASLDSEFGVKTIEDAEKLLQELDDTDKRLATEEDSVVAKLESDYVW